MVSPPLKTPRKKARIQISSPGALSGFGYRLFYTAAARRKALEKSVKKYGYAKTMARVNALYVYNKNSNKVYAHTAELDKKWLMRNF